MAGNDPNNAIAVVIVGTVPNNNIVASTTATTVSSPGVYPINIQTCNSSNYNIVIMPGTLTVTTGPLVAPSISCPSDITVSSTPGQCGAAVNFSATDNVGNPASSISYSHNPGSIFPVGTTTVTATARNALGSSACTFRVIVTDNQAPTAICQPVTVSLGGNGTATVDAATINNGSTDNCSEPLTYEFLVHGTDGGQRTTAVNNGTRTGRNITGITYTYNGRQRTLTPANAIRSTLVLSTLTANPTPGGDANRFWDASATTMSEATALRVLGDFDLGTAFQDCADPVGVNHRVMFDTPIVPGAGPEIFIVHGGLAFDIEILDINGNVALTIPASVIDNSSNVTIGGSAVSDVFNAFYLRNNVNYAVEYSPLHYDTQDQILALDINYNEVPLIGGIRFGGGSCNYVYEILGYQPGPTTAPQIVFTSANLGVNPVTLQVTDGSGNSSTCTTNVTVLDNTPTARASGAQKGKAVAATTQDKPETLPLKTGVFPNPATSGLKVQLDKQVTSVNDIVVVDIAGKVFKNAGIKKVSDKLFEINVSVLPKGVYFIKARTVEGDRIFKFVKM